MDDARTMDAHAQKLVDVAVEEQIRRGYAIVELPAAYHAQLLAEREVSPVLPNARRYRFTKLTPKKRALVAAATQKRYFADLRNQDLLSRAQIRKLNLERGQWTEVEEARIRELQDKVNEMSQRVYIDGMNVESQWRQDRVAAIVAFHEALQAADPDGNRILDDATMLAIQERFTRWLGWSKDRQVEYTEQFAASQGLPEYSPDADLAWIGDRLPSLAATDALNEVIETSTRLDDLDQLLIWRRELAALQVLEAKMYADCVEQRRDYAEEMARLYYLTEALGDRDIPTGPMTKALDDLYNLPDDVVQWFFIELYLFLNGVPSETREYLETMGFLPAPRPTGSSESSDVSPAEPSSKTDTPLLEATPSSSSEVASIPRPAVRQEPEVLSAIRPAPTISATSS